MNIKSSHELWLCYWYGYVLWGSVINFLKIGLNSSYIIYLLCWYALRKWLNEGNVSPLLPSTLIRATLHWILQQKRKAKKGGVREEACLDLLIKHREKHWFWCIFSFLIKLFLILPTKRSQKGVRVRRVQCWQRSSVEALASTQN